jgi:hypothetical protein
MFESSKNVLARAAIFGASFVVTALLMVVVGAAFDSASSQPWLRDSPQARQAVAHCRAHAGRAAQRDCLSQVVAAARARDAGVAHWAALPPAQPDGPQAAR